LLLAVSVPQQQGVSAVRILETEDLLTNQVLVHLSLQGLPKPNQGWLKFKQFGEEWKLDDLDPKGPNSRTGLPHPYAQYGGIGVGLDLDPERHAPRITMVLPNSAAAQAGLLPGLMVVRINGTLTAGKTLAESVYLTRGRVGSAVVLELFNPEIKQTMALELTRQTLALPAATK
jgi:predicted metalloprotease with PDZ domain